MTATLRRDLATGRAWLEFPGRPDATTIAALKRDGWRWSGYRKQWHTNRRFAVPPVEIPHEDGGTCDYSEERAGRLEERAGRKQSAADAAHTRAQRIASAIPLGQPILVGHHSERRHRRDLARIDAGYRQAFELGDAARDLARRADANEAHRERAASAGVTSRRIDRLRTELRKMDRVLAGAVVGEHCWTAENLAEYRRRRDLVAGDVARNEATLAEVAPATPEPARGEVWRVKCWVVRIDRVNRRTVSGTIVQGGAAGMAGKWDRSHLHERVSP